MLFVQRNISLSGCKFIALVFDQEEETRDDEIVISLKLFLFLLVDDWND